MQNCTTILGIIDMRQRGISYDDCRSRYKVGCSTITLIMNRFKESGKDLDTLKQMSAEEVEHLFFPPENLRRKDDSVMPDYQAVYERLIMPGSKANLFYLWLKYKKDCPSGYQLNASLKSITARKLSAWSWNGFQEKRFTSTGSVINRKFLWIHQLVK